MAKVQCSCGYQKEVDDKHIGKKASCPKCKKTVVVFNHQEITQPIKEKPITVSAEIISPPQTPETDNERTKDSPIESDTKSENKKNTALDKFIGFPLELAQFFLNKTKDIWAWFCQKKIVWKIFLFPVCSVSCLFCIAISFFFCVIFVIFNTLLIVAMILSVIPSC